MRNQQCDTRKSGTWKGDAERELLRSESFLQTIINGIQDHIIVVGRDGKILDVNEALAKAMGLPKTKIVGKFCCELAHSDLCIDQPCPVKSVFQTGQPSQVCHTHYDKEGNLRYKEITMYPVKDDNGHAIYAIEILRDVTKGMFLQQEIKESEEKFRGIVETATDAIVAIDHNHKIILFNKAAEEIFGYMREEVLGKDLNILILSQVGDHYRHVTRYMETRKPHLIGRVVEDTALRKGGEEFPVTIARSVTKVKGGPVFTAIIRDQTQTKQMERRLIQSERLAAVGEVVAHVSHEIRNPLTIIGGFANQLIRSAGVTEKDKQKLQIIANEVKRLEQFLGGVGDFTKPIEPVRQMENVNDIVETTYALLEGEARERDIEFEKNLDHNIPLSMVDPNQIKQMLLNLVKNALEATSRGGKISICTELDDHHIRMHVSDTGTGIPRGLLGEIFHPFFTTKKSGTGLGLSMCYKIIKNHGGEIRVQSKLREGSIFTIDLPITGH